MASRDHLADLRRILAANRPGYQVDSAELIGAGLDNLAYEVNGELIVRLRKQPDPVRLSKEARLLTVVATVSPVPVPVPLFTVADQGWLAYAKLPGLPVAQLPLVQRQAYGPPIAVRLGELLTALHGLAVDRISDLVEPDDQPLAEWQHEAALTYASVAGRVPAIHRRCVDAFFEAPPPDDGWAPAFSHNDLGIEHVLVDPATGAVTGVIDWSDAAIVDPAYDFGLIYRDLGPAAARAALGRYRSGSNDLAALAERAAFYARCSVFEDLEYGLDTGQDAYVARSLAAMEWLFPG